MKNFFYKILFIISLFIINLIFVQGANAQISILNSNTSSKIYLKEQVDNYNELWNEIIFTLNKADIKYSIISEEELKNNNIQNYNIIILPLILGLPQECLTKLEDYTKNGGKIIVIFPGVYISQISEKLAEIVNVQLDQLGENSSKTYITWLGEEKTPENKFPLPVNIATIRLTSSAKPLAVWENIEENLPAVTISDKGSYINWRWGNQGNSEFNIFTMKTLINLLIPETTPKKQSFPTSLDIDKFQDRLNEIEKFRKNIQETLDVIVQSNSGSSLADIQEYIYNSKIHENLSKYYYNDNEYEKALDELKNAKNNIIKAYAKAKPSSIAEGRSIWLDRGTIVSIKTPEEMENLFDKIQKTGINSVYIETVNAGYVIYPSKITEQNPLTKGWDPLYWAIKEAHKRKIEIHAWAWIFAVGNTRHNPIIQKANDYAGPILSKNYDLALLGSEGNFIPINQHEYWLDPANGKAREFIISLLEEIVENYQIDGIQLDYIRYPFQNSVNQMGFDVESRQKFEKDTGCSLDKLDEATFKLWNIWKTEQVSKFVNDVSTRLRKIKPDIQISAAVFGGDKQKRISTIQQDWETWIEKGWVNILNPMIYSPNATQLSENLDYFLKTVKNKALVYPGIAVRQLGDFDLLEQIYTVRNLGLLGNTIFAMAHLDNEKAELLSSGPYRIKNAKIPAKNPLSSACALIEEFLYNINTIKQFQDNYFVENNCFIDEIISETGKVHTYILGVSDQPSLPDIEEALLMMQKLEYLANNWLITEKQLKPATVKQLLSYLTEAKELILYEQHKQNQAKFR
ncbi:MAG: family 10 glycosylhydrolase [bacterium]